MGQGTLPKPVVQWWPRSLKSSSSRRGTCNATYNERISAHSRRGPVHLCAGERNKKLGRNPEHLFEGGWEGRVVGVKRRRARASSGMPGWPNKWAAARGGPSRMPSRPSSLQLYGQHTLHPPPRAPKKQESAEFSWVGFLGAGQGLLLARRGRVYWAT